MEQLEGSRLFQVQASLGTFVRAWFRKIAPNGLLRCLLQIFRKLFPRVPLPLPAESDVIRGHPVRSPDRLVLHAKKRQGVLTRVLFVFIPCRFQRVMGYSGIMWRKSVSEETLRMLVNPCGKGSKRKQDDLALEEHECWVETLQKDLPDDDDPGDPSYEPRKLETDSEEYKSQNNTETDLEVEEEDGVMMLKDYPDQKEEEDEETAAVPPETKANGGEPLVLQNPGDRTEDPEWWVLKNSIFESVTEESHVGRAPQSQGPAARCLLDADKPASSSSPEKRVDMTSE